MTCNHYREMSRTKMPWEVTRAERAAHSKHYNECASCQARENAAAAEAAKVLPIDIVVLGTLAMFDLAMQDRADPEV